MNSQTPGRGIILIALGLVLPACASPSPSSEPTRDIASLLLTQTATPVLSEVPPELLGEPLPSDPPTVQPTVAPPTAAATPEWVFHLEGRLLISADLHLYELPLDQIANNPNRPLELLGPLPLEGGFSLDHTKFLYQPATGQQVVLLDIPTGQSQVVLSESVECVSLSTDGSRFSAVAEHELRIYDLSGNYQTIASAPSAIYSPLPGVPDSGSPVFASIECGEWLSPDQLLFHQFTGPMPSELEAGDMPAANTTTLVNLQAEPVLQDTADLWNIVDICADGSQTLLVNREREFFVAEEIKTVENFKDLPLDINPSQRVVSNSFRQSVGFFNAACDIYYRAESEPRAIHILESQTLTDSIVYTVPLTQLPTGWEAVWIEIDNNRLMPLIGTAGTSTADPFYLYIANLDTGEHVQIGAFTGVAPIGVIAWLP